MRWPQSNDFGQGSYRKFSALCSWEADEELRHRGEIIAEKVLGWKKYKVSNGEQEAYGPSQQVVLEELGPGFQLLHLVDKAIETMKKSNYETGMQYWPKPYDGPVQ